MLRRGDIILTHSNTIIGWLIQKVTRSYWNHSAWALGPDILIEALGGKGVIIVNSSKYNLLDQNKTRIIRIKPGEVSEEKLTKALVLAQSKQGSNYDWWLILQLAYLYLFESGKNNGLDDWDSSWICSELIAKPLWLEAGFRFSETVPVENIVPEDIFVSEKVETVSPE